MSAKKLRKYRVKPPWWVYLAKGVRMFAYGTAAVAIPLWFAHRGFSPGLVGLLIALALAGGAAQSWMTGWFARRYSTRAILCVASIAMACGALLFAAHNIVLFPLGALLGGMNMSGHESGPFTAVEQVVVRGMSISAYRFAGYNAIGSLCVALGGILGGTVDIGAAAALYFACAVILILLYMYCVPREPPLTASSPSKTFERQRFGVAERFASLFAVDAFAGEFVAQGFIVYWFTLQYHPDPRVLGFVFAAASVLSGFSLFIAAWIATRIGLLRTMVFTHLPSNVLLALIPFAPSFPIAVSILLARAALSQMDVPTRQALVLHSVPEDQRVHAAGVTNAVRPAAAALSPTLAGLAMQTLGAGVPFFVAGVLKTTYDLALLFWVPKITNLSDRFAARNVT